MQKLVWGTIMLDPSSWIRINKFLTRRYGIEETILFSAHMDIFTNNGEVKYTISRAEMEERTTIPERRQRDLEDRLIRYGLLIRTAEGLPRKNFYFINSDKVNSDVDEITEEFAKS